MKLLSNSMPPPGTLSGQMLFNCRWAFQASGTLLVQTMNANELAKDSFYPSCEQKLCRIAEGIKAANRPIL
jgi:hypothetical protein